MSDLMGHRLAMLAQTLGFAQQRSPFYRYLLPGGEIRPLDSAQILRALPILDAHAWEKVRIQLRTGPVDNAITGFTNGTTGTPKLFYNTSAELDSFTADASLDNRRRLKLIALNHGVADSIDAEPDVCNVPLVSERYFDLAARIIAQEDEGFKGPQVRILSGTLRHIKDLTLYMMERYERLDNFGVQTIEAGRHMLSARWRERLRSLWNAEVIPIYGFSELRMCNARKCMACDYFHLPPSCIGEVIDLHDPSRYVTPGGRGALVVTAFYPYVQAEPRLRYRPGDAVELANVPCPEWGELGFQPLGREKDCFAIEGGTETITPADCFAILADLPQVAVRHEAHAMTGLDDRYHESGSPRFSLQRNKGRIELHIELRFDPRLWESEAAFVQETIRNSLSDRVAVLMHGPGKIVDPYFL